MTERTRLSDELSAIDARIGEMAAKAGEALRMALQAMKTQNLELARRVKEGDTDIDALQAEIEDLASVTLATQQPVASDLRILVAAFKVAADYERAADYAVHLAKATKKFAGEPKSRQVERLIAMAELDEKMMRGTAEAFRTRSSEAAISVAAMDDAVDAEHKALLNEVLDMMRERPDEAERAAKLLTTSGYLERLGDHMTNACESIVFMTRGTRVDLNE